MLQFSIAAKSCGTRYCTQPLHICDLDVCHIMIGTYLGQLVQVMARRRTLHGQMMIYIVLHGWFRSKVALRGWILKPVHQASHPWLPTSALQGASHPVSNQHNGAPRVPMSTDPVEAVTRKGHQVTMGLLSQDPKWLTTHMCWHAKQCRKCICRMHNLLFNHYATHWGWVKHLTSSIIFMI